MAESSQHSPDASSLPSSADGASRVISTLGEEFAALRPRLLLARLLCAVLPDMVGNRLRVYALRAAGFQIGHGCMMYAMPRITGGGPIRQRLKIGQHCLFNVGCLLDLADSITIGDRVGVGHEVLFLTASHEIGSREQRAGAITTAPITIGDGVWIGSRCVILPGVTVGAGSVISVGSIVNCDVPPQTLIKGTQKVSLARWRS
jgi:maltose O-acetyltransferase